MKVGSLKVKLEAGLMVVSIKTGVSASKSSSEKLYGGYDRILLDSVNSGFIVDLQIKYYEIWQF